MIQPIRIAIVGDYNEYLVSLFFKIYGISDLDLKQISLESLPYRAFMLGQIS